MWPKCHQVPDLPVGKAIRHRHFRHLAVYGPQLVVGHEVLSRREAATVAFSRSVHFEPIAADMREFWAVRRPGGVTVGAMTEQQPYDFLTRFLSLRCAAIQERNEFSPSTAPITSDRRLLGRYTTGLLSDDLAGAPRPGRWPAPISFDLASRPASAVRGSGEVLVYCRSGIGSHHN